MTMPTLVIDPVTGLKCWTKHPDKLIARRQAKMELQRLVITAKRLNLQVESYSIKVVNTKTSKIDGSPRVPVTQWLHA
jgi:hypothetical protein